MKTINLILIILCVNTYLVNAQQVTKLSFENSSQTIQRKKDSASYPIVILKDSIGIADELLKLYTLTASVNNSKTTLPNSDFSLEFNSISLDKLPSKYTFFVTIKGDSISDRSRTIHLDLVLKKTGETTNTNFSSNNASHVITVKDFEVVSNYDYLGYVGTNFDLIDGAKPQDLFFAINISSPPREANSKFGFIMSLYGNRTFSSIDTSGIVSYISRYEPIGGDSVAYFRSQAEKTVVTVSDNIGAMFTPLFKLGSWSDPARKTQLYYAPQFEFIWRRKTTTTSYINSVVTDTTYRANRPLVTRRTFPEIEKIRMNVYDVYFGLLGLSLYHENELISIRIQGSIGRNFSYRPERIERNQPGLLAPADFRYIKEENWFTYFRTFITEPKSGITFGAEVSNYVFNPGRYNPYYNVTLSKAFTLNALGSIFQPITSR